MLDFLETVGEIVDLVISWRLWSVWIATACLCFLVVFSTPNRAVGYSVALLIGLTGFFGGIYWQRNAEET